MSSAKMQITCTIFVIFITLSKTENRINLTSSSTLNETDSGDVLTEIQCHTRARLRNITYTWNIEHFDLHRPRLGDPNPIKSPIFSSAINKQVKWYLEVHPRNTTCDTIGVYLYCVSKKNESKVVPVYFSFSFLDSEGNLLKELLSPLCTFKRNLPNFDNRWGYDALSVNEVVSPDNSLNIVCNIAMCEYTNNVVYRNGTYPTSNPDYNRSREDIPSIENSQPSNVVLVLTKNGRKYPAGKVILALAARSPIFAAMLEDRMEKGEGMQRVNLPDVDEQVFDELLNYIYTNKTENIDGIATDLLIVANKFGLDDLKTSCVKEICKNLTIRNAVNTLLLADKNGFGELKSNAIRFIVDYYRQVANTTDWKQILETNTKLASEVMQSYIARNPIMK